MQWVGRGAITQVFSAITICVLWCSRYLWSLDGIHWNSTTPEQPWCSNQVRVDMIAFARVIDHVITGNLNALSHCICAVYGGWKLNYLLQYTAEVSCGTCCVACTCIAVVVCRLIVVTHSRMVRLLICRPKWYVDEHGTATLLFTGVNREGDGGMGNTWTMVRAFHERTICIWIVFSTVVVLLCSDRPGNCELKPLQSDVDASVGVGTRDNHSAGTRSHVYQCAIQENH